jgi:pimeloyl-ACP methyl ester carboxylesterase
MTLAGADAHVIALDLPGVGGSTGPVAGGSKRQLAGLVEALIDRLGLNRVTLVGHDIGGMIAYSYLRQYNNAARVVIMDTVIPGVDPWDEVLRNPYIWHFAFHTIEGLPELLVEGHQREYFDFFFDVLSVDPTKIIPEVRREYAATYGTVQSLSAGFDFYRAFARDAEDNIAFSSGPSVSTPCLYMRGEGELGGIENYVRGLRNAGISNLFSTEVPDAGHFTLEEQPAAVWQIVRDFADGGVATQ